MIKRLAVFFVILTVFTGAVQASENYSQSFKLDAGNQIQLGGYEFRFYEGDNNKGIFQTGVVKQNGGTLITKQLIGEEIENTTGETYRLDENLSYSITEYSNSYRGEYIRIQAEADSDIFSDASLKADNPQRVLVDQGGSVSFGVEIENTGVVNQTFQLSNTGEGISSSFTYQGYNVSQVFVPYGESRNLNVELNVAENTSIGLREVEVLAENRSTASDKVLLSVLEKESQERGEPRIDLSLNEQYARTNPGEELSVPVTVRNSGRVVLENVEISVEGPEGWETELTPKNHGTLDQYRSGRTTLTITPPSDAQQGDFFVDVSASSDQVGLDEPQQIRVNISEKSGLRYIGIVLMVVSLLALILVYWRFGRR